MHIAKRNDDGELLVRDSQLAAFFCQHPYRELAKAFGGVFEDWIRRAPAEAKTWALIGPNADEQKPLTAKLLERARAQFDPARAKKSDMSAIQIGGPQESNPDHAFVFVGDNDIAGDQTNMLEIRSPSAEVDADRVERYVETIRHIAEQIPYDSGYASLALTHIADRQKAEFAEAARKWAFRHPGFDMPENDATNSRIGRKVRGAYWLTFVGPWAVEKLGGEKALRKALPKEIDVQAVGVGVMIRCGQLPAEGDLNRDEKLPLVRAVAKVLEPVTLFGDRFLNTLFRDEDERARWERRHLD